MTNTPASATVDSTVHDMVDMLDAFAVLEPATTQTDAFDRIQAAERLKAACAALQARETAALERLRHDEEALRGVPKKRRGKGLSAEIGLARGKSPTRGSRCLKLSTALTFDLPNTREALTTGKISEELAHAVTRETAWLSAADRQTVDAMIADRLGSLGPLQLAAEVRSHAQRLDQAAAVKQLARAKSERRVSVRPAPENMAYVTALLPMQQAVGAYASLRRDAITMVGTGETADPADPTSTPRSRDQIMADLFVERLTGQITAPAVPAEVHVVMTDAALFGDDETPHG